MAAKKASLHIYVLRSIYNIVSVFRSLDNSEYFHLFNINKFGNRSYWMGGGLIFTIPTEYKINVYHCIRYFKNSI